MIMGNKWAWMLPLIILLLLSPFLSWIDLETTSYFYSIGNDPVEHFVTNRFFDFVFDFGVWPANLTALFAAFGVAFSYLFSKCRSWRAPCLVLLLSYALGAGLIINGTLKEYWGRPRPKQVEQFGGTQSFRPFYSPQFFNQPQPSKSFTCGHCAMGFYFFALAFVGARLKNRTVESIGFILACVLGILLSVMRVAQGGHFVSDALFSAAIMWYTALAVDWLVYKAEGA